MLETSDLSIPTNQRVKFFLRQGSDLYYCGAIPLFVGFITAPLYDHCSARTQVIIILFIFAVSWPWVRYIQLWLDNRIGLFRARPSRSIAIHEPLKLRFFHNVVLWVAIFAWAGIIAFLRRHAHSYKPSGWIEQAVGVWLVGAIFLCLKRTTDLTNPRQRRLWSGIAACILAIGWGFEGASPYSHAALLVLLGSVHIALALLDIGLILHFAATPLSLDTENAHAS